MKYASYKIDDYAASIMTFNEADINISAILAQIRKALEWLVNLITKNKSNADSKVDNIKEKSKWLESNKGKKISVTQKFIVVDEYNIEDLKNLISSKVQLIKKYSDDNSNIDNTDYWEKNIQEYNKKAMIKKQKMSEYIRDKLGITATMNEEGTLMYTSKEYSFDSTDKALEFCSDKIRYLESVKSITVPYLKELRGLQEKIPTMSGTAKIPALKNMVSNMTDNLRSIDQVIINIINAFDMQFAKLVQQIASEVKEQASSTESPSAN